ARMRGILESAMDAIITVDDQQRVVVFNTAAEKMFGWSREEAIGQPLGSFIPARFQKAHVGHVQKFGITNVSSRRMATARVVTGMRRDGHEFPIDASISQLRQQGRLFYTVILRDVSELVRAEAAVRASKDELQELASAASSALEREKSRIARELHDELAQSLTTLKMDISLIRVTQPDPDDELLERLAKMEQQIDVTIKSMRRIAADLRPLTLDDLGLVPAVEALVNNFAQHSGIECELAVSQPEYELSDAQATAVFRTVQEALTNIVKHSKARRVEVVIEQNEGDLMVTITDDGVGFATEAPRRHNAYGLLGLRERAYLLGGDASIESAPGRGTSIGVRFPLAGRVPVT
ncbi:MAG TPA: PAS domain-containing sensor histidine kinase, partial [Casimicrobiaceae bacterium]|nr:PAS domain-containing sensor histidine kinase [Casimicrobiaceae bacterium]